MLTGEARNGVGAFALFAVACPTSRNVVCLDAVLKNLLPRRHQRGIARRTCRWRLRGIIGGEPVNCRITQSRRHAPHIGVRMRVRARMVAKCAELIDQIVVLLAGKPRKGWRNASTLEPVTRRADMHRP